MSACTRLSRAPKMTCLKNIDIESVAKKLTKKKKKKAPGSRLNWKKEG
jgi:hypothetical protein